MRLAEEFSRAGVPAFVSDVKGDLAALARSCPCDLLDLFGQSGRPIHATFAAMGADLVARALELSDAQAACVEVAFAYARDRGLPLDTLNDFRALLVAVQLDRDIVSARYGQVSTASVGVVQRQLLRLEGQGGASFFAAPAFDVAALLDKPGKVSILAADRLIQSPRLYSAFLLWMLSDLYQRLPEVGDLDKPRLVFFFDEAHLLFSDCPPALLRRIEQTVRLIRSKGVGVYFVSQSPDDVPHLVREQLAHRIEHNRALPIGAARVVTMTDSGQPVTLPMVKVDLPSCELGPLAPAERPALPVSVPVAGSMDWHGYLFLAVAAGALIALAWGVWSITANGAWPMTLAVLIALALALRGGRR